MTAKSRSLDVSIMGRSYKVTCADGEREALLQAVTYLDQKMNEIKSSGRVGSIERIAVMAALNITHEFLATRVAGDFDFASLKRRIDSMQETLDEVLAPQERLF
ncbi:MAG: cell division protein ZapA [Burkholderiales bacterium]